MRKNLAKKNATTKMKIKLNNKFYSRAAIDEAILAFKELCNFNIIDDSFEIEILPKKKEANIENEFCNFVLGFTKDSLI